MQKMHDNFLFIFHACHLELSKGHLLQVEWAKIWPDEWVVACPPPEEPAEVEVVLCGHLCTAVHKPLPHGCLQLIITS